MTEPAPDPLAALRGYLLADTEIEAAVDGRVWFPAVPPSENGGMPRAAIVLAPAGGAAALGRGQLFGDSRVDVRSYGPTLNAARDLDRLVYPAFKHLQRVVFAGCLIHWANEAGGPLTRLDADTGWPYTLRVFQVLASEISATV